MKKIIIGFALIFSTIRSFSGPNDSNWVQLLRAGDTALSDWNIKIQNQPLGVNAKGSFKYAVSKDTHEPRLEVIDTMGFGGDYGFGHIFYKTPYSNYLLRAKFHFPTRDSYGGQGWTTQNNGLMLHCQNPTTMTLGQDYPNSIEDQLLGYWSTAAGNPPDARSSNVCLPGSNVDINGQNVNNHCANAKDHSLLYDSSVTPAKGANSSNTTWPGANIWQYAMAKVMDSSYMTFYVRNRPDTAWDSVLHITNIRVDKKPTGSGYIALQMEGTSTEFAQIELLNLVGCMTPSDANFKSYFVKNDPAACGKPTFLSAQRKAQNEFTLIGNRLTSKNKIQFVEILKVDGTLITTFNGHDNNEIDLNGLKSGMYQIRVHTQTGNSMSTFLKI